MDKPKCELTRELVEQIEKIARSERAFFVYPSGISSRPVEPTPYRGVLKMYEVEPHKNDLEIDCLINEIAAVLSPNSNRIQSNIDSFDRNCWTPALHFHFDRGARFTILGTVRGDSTKATVLLPISNIIDEIDDESVANILCGHRFIAPQKTETGTPLFPLIDRHDKHGYVLSSHVVKNELEFPDVKEAQGWYDARLALLKLNQTIDRFNDRLGNMKMPTDGDSVCKFETGMFSVSLQEGDILVMNNRLLLHGRTSGRVTNIDYNRWLRVSFIE